AVSTMDSVRVLKDILSVVAEALHDESYLDLQEAFIDGGFAPAQKGGRCVGQTKRGKGAKIIAIPGPQGRPVAPRRERYAARSHTAACHTRGAVCQSAPGAPHRRQPVQVGQTGCGPCAVAWN